MRTLLMRLGELLIAGAILCAVFIANVELVKLVSFWWLMLSVPLTLAAGFRMWVEFMFYVDGYWYQKNPIETNEPL